MAANNYFTVVNFSGRSLSVTINGVDVDVPQDGTSSTLQKFPESGEAFGVDISTASGGSASIGDFHVSAGTNSFSTFTFTTNGYVNTFASNASGNHLL